MSLLVRSFVIAACGAAGYFGSSALATKSSPAAAHNAYDKSSSAPATGTGVAASAAAPKAELKPPDKSALVNEWKQFRGSSATAAELQSLYLQVKEIPDPFRRRAFRSALIAEWAAVDPHAAMTFLKEKDGGMMVQFTREWLRKDPDGAVTALVGGGDKTRSTLWGMLGENALRSLLGDIARAAPHRLGEVVSALPKSNNRWDTSAEQAFTTAAQESLESARTAALAIQGPLRGEALSGVVKVWAERNGLEALAWAQALPQGVDRDAALKATLIGWAKTDPAAALEQIGLVPPGAQEGYYASDVGAQVLREAAKQDWDKTIAWLRENPGKLGRQSLDGLPGVLNDRLAADTEGTMRALMQSGVPGLQQVFANAVLNDAYSQRDRLWEWLDSQPASEFTRDARRSLMNAIAYKEPTKAMEFLERLPSDSPEDRQLLEMSARSLINGGQELGRLDQLLEKSSPKLRPILLSLGFEYGFMSDSPKIEPQRWAARLEELPADRRDNAINGLARGWAMLDPEAAIAWGSSLPDERQRELALSSAVGSWVMADPHDAAQWVNTLPEGRERDRAVLPLVGALANTEPEAAWQWAQSVGGEHRQRALGLAYFAAHQRDPAAAREMLQGSGISQEEQQWILTELERLPKLPRGATRVIRTY